MCTYVETADVKLLIDAGAALGPRFRKLPHPREYQARVECRSRIREYAAKADAIVVSHYHNDHHTPNYTESVWVGSSPEESEQVYRDKLVLAKDIRNSINFAQRRRGWMFQRFVKRVGGKCEIADGRTFEFGSTRISLSQPVPHGEEDSEMGWVLMTRVECGDETFIHSSDVQGPISKRTLELILKEKPDVLVLGGPPTYLKGIRVAEQPIQNGMMNAAILAATVPTVIFEHHILRSEFWVADAEPVFDSANKSGNKIVTAAEYLGQPSLILESRRLKLYEEEEPSPEFLKWTELAREKRQLISPPI
jgi:predicted metallo-beta-lactamase superfamily hydrolase